MVSCMSCDAWILIDITASVHSLLFQRTSEGARITTLLRSSGISFRFLVHVWMQYVSACLSVAVSLFHRLSLATPHRSLRYIIQHQHETIHPSDF